MVEVLGVKLFNLNIRDAYAEMVRVVQGRERPTNRLISATGAHGLVMAQKDESLKKILNDFYINLPDGVPGVWVGRLKGNRQMEVCPGPDFFEYVMRQSASDGCMRHFFCGGKEGVADELKAACAQKFQNRNIVGTYSPPFREMTDDEMRSLAKEMERVNANVLWIGLSTPKQEKFAYRLKNFTSVHFIVTVGAAFDFHTGRVKYAPAWMQNNGLGWFYRMLMEPKRLVARYMETVPLFIYFNLKELFTTYIFKNTKTVQL